MEGAAAAADASEKKRMGVLRIDKFKDFADGSVRGGWDRIRVAREFQIRLRD